MQENRKKKDVYKEIVAFMCKKRKSILQFVQKCGSITTEKWI